MNLMIEMLKAILLGIVQGITEWLPISSTGHMILVNELMPLTVLADAAANKEICRYVYGCHPVWVHSWLVPRRCISMNLNPFSAT